MIGVVAHQGGEVERDGQPAAAVLEQIFVALVGLLRRSEAGELPHRIKLAAISRSMNPACERRLAGISEISFFAPVGGKIGLRVEASNGHTGDCREARAAVLVDIHARRRADRPLRSLFERGCQRLLSPLLLRVRRMAVLKRVSSGTIGHLLLRKLLLHAIPSSSLMIGKACNWSKAANTRQERPVGQQTKTHALLSLQSHLP